MENVCSSADLSVIAEVELIYKTSRHSSQMQQITSSAKAYEILLNNWDHYRIEYLEQFRILLLNRSNHVLGIYEVSSGGVSGTVVDPKLIFTAALKTNASGLILAHNHPSRSINPSIADRTITKQLCEAGKVLDIKILDHLIITPEKYYSFSDEGLL